MASVITTVDRGSPAERAGFAAGETLVSVNGHGITDVLDYQFYTYEDRLKVVVEHGGNRRTVPVEKQVGEPLGLGFETYLIDEQKSCFNKCIFCFIDQNPKGMRDTIYFKDDDARLSFLVGNYISLTNLSDDEAQRVIDMRFSPINISVHTTDPALRDLMLGNRFGGSSLRHLWRFVEAGLDIKTQIVVCPGVNDGQQLKKTIADLSGAYPAVSSIAVVPVGISRHRDGLYPLQPMNEQCAREVLATIDAARLANQTKHGAPLVYAADELYVKAGQEMPAPDYYDAYEQLENGVGLMALLEEQVQEELEYGEHPCAADCTFTIATGVDAAPFMEKMLDYCRGKWHNLNCTVVPIQNDFYGRTVTVAGLVTGGDIIAQLKGKDIGSVLLLPICMLRHQEDVFLDGITIKQAEQQLGVKIVACEIDGAELVKTLAGAQ